MLISKKEVELLFSNATNQSMYTLIAFTVLFSFFESVLIVLLLDYKETNIINLYLLSTSALFLIGAIFMNLLHFKLIRVFAHKENIMSNKSDAPINKKYPLVLNLRSQKKLIMNIYLFQSLVGILILSVLYLT